MGSRDFKMGSRGRLSWGGSCARSPIYKRMAKRPTVQRQRLGATVGSSSGRPTCVGEAPCVRNDRIIGGVIHPATLCRVPRIRLRLEVENTLEEPRRDRALRSFLRENPPPQPLWKATIRSAWHFNGLRSA